MKEPEAVVIHLTLKSLPLALPLLTLGLFFIPPAFLLAACYKKLGWIKFMQAHEADNLGFEKDETTQLSRRLAL